MVSLEDYLINDEGITLRSHDYKGYGLDLIRSVGAVEIKLVGYSKETTMATWWLRGDPAVVLPKVAEEMSLDPELVTIRSVEEV